MKATRFLAPLLVLALACLPMRSAAEEDDDAERLMPFAIRESNTARFGVMETRRLLAQGRTAQALRLAQEVLDDLPEDYFRVSSPEPSTNWRLAAEEIRDILARMRPSERDAYDRLSRPSTVPLIERAVRQHDTTLLAELVTRYGASRHGVEAARLLADLALEEGRAREAAWWAREGLRYAQRDTGLWLRLVDALAASNDRLALDALDVPDGLVLSGGEAGVATVADRIAAWRREISLPVRDGTWPLWGGDPSRSALSPPTSPTPTSLRWEAGVPRVRGVLDTDAPNLRGRPEQARFQRHWTRFRPLHPVARGRTIFVADGRTVRALDLYSGRSIWVYDRESEDELPLISPRVRSRGRTSFERPFTPVLWGNLVLATVEVYVAYRPDNLNGIEISTYLPRRVVVALDAQTGRRVWVMGQGEEDAAALEGMSLISPCVVAEDLVLAVASRHEGQHHVLMVAFDAATGRLAWKRSVGWGQQELNLFGAPAKELAASAPAVADGVVYAATGLGFVAAADVWTGRPRWLSSYQIQEIEGVDEWYYVPLRWPLAAPSPPVVAGDLVLVAPTDGKHLHAYSRADGTLRWRAPYPRAPLDGAPPHFLGIVHDGQRDVALLCGADVIAYDVGTGEQVWAGRMQDEFGEQNVVVGRGAVSAAEVLVPTTNGLVRFSVPREGSFLSRDPWPVNVEPGNLLALERILLVSTRDEVQAFYTWSEVEEDVAQRRRASPDDAQILLEAGEIYRMGGALERAARAFLDALEVARRTEDADGGGKAAQGLFRTWISAAAAAAQTRPQDARKALAEALAWARTPFERVQARVLLDGLLKELPEERVANLERLVEEAEDTQATFQDDEDSVPARAMALLRLASVEETRGRPHEAVEALQRVLRSDGNAVIRGLPARHHARRRIDEILGVWGVDVYAPHEEAARRLLETAQRSGDRDLLDRILREFPNASVVPAALIGLGRAHLEAGRAERAAEVLLRLLDEHAEGVDAPRAAAVLSRAFDRQGLSGARRFTLAWIETRHPDAHFMVDGRDVTGRAFVAAERQAPRLPLPAEEAALTLPLDEVIFEKVEESSWGRGLKLTVPEGTRAPLALMTDGRRRVYAFDLVGARLAWTMERGPYHRGFYDDGILVLAAGRALRGVTSDAGQVLWDREIEGTVLDLQGAPGVVYALLHDTRRGRQGQRRLVVLDSTRGHVLWSKDLEAESNTRQIMSAGADVLIRDGTLRPTVRVVDGLTGRIRHVIALPEERRTDREPVIVAGHLVAAWRDRSQVPLIRAHALSTGELAWSRTLPGERRTSSLVADGDDVVALQEDGYLTTFDVESGEIVQETRIYAGGDIGAWPFTNTALIPDGDLAYLMPRVQRPPARVGAWDRETGKLIWDTPWTQTDRVPGGSALMRTDGGLLALTPFTTPRAPGSQERPPTRVFLRVLDLGSGEVLQEVEAVGLAPDHGLLSLAHGWGTILVVGQAGAALYGAGTRAR